VRAKSIHYLTPLFLGLSGCAATVTDDISFKSVQSVDWRSQTEMPGPNASPLRGVLSEAQLSAAGESVMGDGKPPRLLLKLEFNSSRDLPEFMAKNSTSLMGFAYPCDDGNKTDLLASGVVYWRGLRLGSQTVSQYLPRPSIFTYYIYVDAVRRPSSNSTSAWRGYDLRERAVDICFGVEGRSETLTRYRSNIAVVPKAAIDVAMRNRPEGF
jgi:hypothetical protein